MNVVTVKRVKTRLVSIASYTSKFVFTVVRFHHNSFTAWKEFSRVDFISLVFSLITKTEPAYEMF
jgi:hypothetical protein